jgi:hypothetical protein
MKLKVRELSYLERGALIDIITQWSSEGYNFTIGFEILARTLEIEGEPLVEERKAGIVIKKLSDAQMEKILSELTPEEIEKYVTEALKVNKLFFLTKADGGTNTENTSTP